MSAFKRIILPPIFYLLTFHTACTNDKGKTNDTSQSYTQPSYVISEVDSASVTIYFEDITEYAGLDFNHETGAFGKKWMPETMGSGGGFLDYNNDNLPDIFLVNSSFWKNHEGNGSKPTPHLYRNLGNGKFEDVTLQAGLNFTLYGMGCSFADFDGDGDTDIYITAVGDNKLLRNDNGVFVDITKKAGVIGNSNIPGDPPAWSTSAAWVDVDRDGWLDLFVGNYVRWSPETDLFTTLDGKNKSYATPQQYQGETCRLYRNIDGRYFEDITKSAGVYNPEGKSLGVAIADFNDDAWPDIVVANDTQPNFLYLNNGDGTFTNIALRAGVAFDEFGRARAGMGLDVGDIRNDGNLSIAIGNFSREPLSLYTQINEELFQDMAGLARLTKPSLLPLSFGVLFADFNLDGYLDLVVGNGHIEPDINSIQQEITFAKKPQLFQNNRKGQFVDISELAGEIFSQPIVARGIATADFDADGDLDILITTNGGAPRLLRNNQKDTKLNWVKFLFQGNSPNLNAIGAKVTVYSNGLVQQRMLRTGSSYLSQSYIGEMVIGLGEESRADSIKIKWPTSRKVTIHGPVEAGKVYTISEASSSMVKTTSAR